MPLGKQGPLAKALTAGIGLTQEYKADRKSRKESESKQGDAGLPPPYAESDKRSRSRSKSRDGLSSEDDEEWARDLDAAEAQYMLAQPEPSPNETEDDIIRNTLSSLPPLTQMSNAGPLGQPVILPQRRPGMRTRGWVRGYAPTLATRDVDQNAWLNFLAGFEKAIGKNRWFHVLNLAVWVADKIRFALQGVSLIAHAVSAFIHMSLEMSRRGYIHSKQNKYLDKLNDEYFKPRGLYALVVKYKPKKEHSSNPFSSSSSSDVSQPIETVDINTNSIDETVEKRIGDEDKFWKGLMKGAASKNTSEAEVPEFAPLVFPYLDDLDEAQKENAMKRNGAFLADYYDRRAQAKFANENPDSKLADVAPRKEFASAYSDPTNPKSQAGLLNTVSGGYLDTPLVMLRNQRKQKPGRLGILGGRDESTLERVQGKKEQRKSMRPMKRLLRQDALYLMVVDLPSQEEQNAVRRAIEQLADE